MTTSRGRNPRGGGTQLRAEIIAAAGRLLEELGDDQALSLRAVARELGIAATSVYLHFADRDALVLAVLQRGQEDLTAAVEQAEAAAADPAAALRARTRVLSAWAQRNPGLFKVLHESTLNQRADMSFKDGLAQRSAAAVERCMEAGLAPAGDPAEVALDLRAAIHGAISLRVNQPGHPWPPIEEQIERFLQKIAGLAGPGARQPG